MSTIDNSVPQGAMGSAGHLAEAHFHGTPTRDPNTVFTQENDFDNTQSLVITGGNHLANGATLGLDDFFVHERNYIAAGNAFLREFTLVLTPSSMPETPSVALLAVAAIASAGVKFSRRWARCS